MGRELLAVIEVAADARPSVRTTALQGVQHSAHRLSPPGSLGCAVSGVVSTLSQRDIGSDCTTAANSAASLACHRPSAARLPATGGGR
jgi:hypothetical protein